MKRYRLPSGVSELLGWYVYILRDPRRRRGATFYVGKGRGSRLLAHVNAALAKPEPGDKLQCIRAIRRAGREVQHIILRHGLATEELAYEVEAAVIDVLDGLTNESKGKHTVRGAVTLDELLERHAAQRLDPKVPCLLIKIQRKWRRGMSEQALYRATRACWRARARRVEDARYVLAVANGIVRGVYRDLQWWPCRRSGARDVGRLEFTGEAAPERSAWIGRSVEHLFHPGNQNPLKYLGC